MVTPPRRFRRLPDSAPSSLPRLGISLSFQCRPDLDEGYEQAWKESLELAVEAERLGVEEIWFPEHHGEEDGYNPSPVVAAAAVAAVTSRVRLCGGIALAPLQGHPLRMAEDLAVVDNLSGGRVELGFGQGYRREEFEAFGLDFDRRTRALREALDVIDLAWGGERFDYDGQLCQVRGGLLRPVPVQPGPPPLWLGAAAPRSRARAVRRGAGLVVAPLTEAVHTARQFEAFDGVAEEVGADALPHALMREIEVGDSDEEALAHVQPYLDHVYRVQYAPERTGLTRVDPGTGERRQLTSQDPYYLSPEFVGERWAIGSAETCAGLVSGWLDRMRLDRLVFQPKMPGRPLADAVRAVERVTTELWPRLRELRGLRSVSSA
ncbi:MAG: LLM class flavin-dependent oxidoreductase [Acidimicrobiia bacterium]|nr:LLM class flavin-dependent oxidoreductase [Acidimicrobiia bacterium]